MVSQTRPPAAIASVLERIDRPTRAVVTAGMPYANGPLHIGHLAGAHLPADIHARWLRMLIGGENVLFVCGTDDHGSTSELMAMREGKPIADVIGTIHAEQTRALSRFAISLDAYSGTSRPETLPRHAALCGQILRKLHDNGLLSRRTSQQWYDPTVKRFLPDRLVRGQCPNPKCDNDQAYSDECDVCGHQHDPTDLIHPRSTVSDATPEMRDTVHLWLDMWPLSDTLRAWIESKRKLWRPVVVRQVLDTVSPSLRFARERENDYKALKASLPKHKMKYAPGQEVVLQLTSKDDLSHAQTLLAQHGIDTSVVDEWAQRPITRDIPWGIPIPDLHPEVEGKTLYVWPDSLIAPITFTQLALESRGLAPDEIDSYWRDPNARIYQFLGQDNVFFYVLMQGALWLGSQQDPTQVPASGDLQFTEVFACFHLQVGGEKMSKTRGNFFTAEQLVDEKGYSVDQIRYYLALLGLSEKPSNFDFDKLDERNAVLSGKINAALERPLSAAHNKFESTVPEGILIDKVEADTARMVQRYVKAMTTANYPSMLFELENYARRINSLFNKYKPHDDRHPEDQRRNALYSAFYLLKNLMIMLHPFVPDTMNTLRESLCLPETVFSTNELGTGIAAGHKVGPKQEFFPTVNRESTA